MKTEQINILKGIAAAPGIIITQAFIYQKEKETISDEKITDIEEACKNLETAVQQSKKELNKIFSLAVDKLGEKRAAIFEAQIMILDDPILFENIRSRIKSEMRTPEFIVHDEISKYIDLLNLSNEAYMKERSHDIEDIKNRIIKNIKKKKWKSRVIADAVIVTGTISPSDTVLFSRDSVRGYVTDFGGLTSHAAIVARSLNIPAVLGVHDATNRIKDGDTLIVDGYKGEVIINPDEKQLSEYNKKIEKLHKYDKELDKLKNLPSTTIDGKEIQLLGNLDLIDELDYMMNNNAKGIGLVRTEQLFEGNDVFPDEETQFKLYKDISERIYPDTVIIRAFDIGGDKVLPVDLKEPNPFLGWRGIRLLLDSKDLFKTQIRAILRASTHKNVKFMIPMVASIAELRETKKIIAECMKELSKESIPYDKHLGIGVMIEIPSAAVMISEFADECEFVSIGTNDLIQYLLAVDRGNDIVSGIYQEFNPAVIRTLNNIIKECKKKGRAVSMCGEMAADPFALPLLIGFGLESFSVSPSAIPILKKLIRTMSFLDAEKLANECLSLKTEKEINNLLHKFFNQELQDQIKSLY